MSKRDEIFREKQKAMSNNELIEIAEQQVLKMCETGGKSFAMSVPIDVKDTDMILCELIRRFRTYAGEPK